MALKYTVDSIEIDVSETDYDKANRIVLNIFRLVVQRMIIVVNVLKLLSPKPKTYLTPLALEMDI